MLDRIRLLLSEQRLSSTQFADVIGVSRPVISHILSGRNKPSLEVVQKILAAFPDLSTTWLLTGAGEMRDTGPSPEAAAPARRKATPPLPVAPAPVEASEPTVAGQSVAQVALASLQEQSVPELLAEEEKTRPAVSSSAAPVTVAPLSSSSSPAPEETGQSVAPQVAAPDSLFAQSLAEPGKRIRRIVIFYQDGTFSDYQPE